jgi:hypothetical protein
MVLIVLALAAAALWWPAGQSGGGLFVRRGPPPVGAYSYKDKGAGEREFAIQTEQGRFDLRVGSHDFRDMPYDFPFYPGARMTGSAVVDGQGAEARGRYVSFQTADSAAKVVDFYRRQALAAKLLIVTDQTIEGVAALTGMYPDGRDGGFQLTVRPSGGRSDATLSSGFGLDVTVVPQPDPELANIMLPDNILEALDDPLGAAAPRP